MPFGLKNVPRMFEHAMDIIFSSVKWQFTIVFLYDIVIFSRAPDEHINHDRQVQMLLNGGVILKVIKCLVFTSVIDAIRSFIKHRR